MNERIAHTTFDRPNVGLLVAVVALGGLSLWQEGYLPRVDAGFVALGLVLGGLAFYVAGFVIQRKRLVALALVAGAGGYLTQVIGATRLGVWTYPEGTFRFVPATFVLASLGAFGLAVTLLRPGLRKLGVLHAGGPLHVLVPIGFFLLVAPALGGDAWALVYYAGLLAVCALGAMTMELALVLGVALAAMLVGGVAEVAGAHATLWLFGGEATWKPPLWLWLGSWPLEVGAHFTISALLVREAIGAHRRHFVEPRLFAPQREHLLWTDGLRQKVVVSRGDDKLRLLADTLERAGLATTLARRCQELGRSASELKVVIKPNFMFMYSEQDRSTFTDPELVEGLVDWLLARGYANVCLVEAQSAYGNYFHDREVANVARLIGYAPRDRYRIVDLTLEKVPHTFAGPLGEHVVGPTWRDADFRISFAKNKTHTWAWYTLCIKNIYGTLPMQDKIHEYHFKREIYYPTIDQLLAFPVHFALIDAFVSADGPFGIFADKHPNLTQTLIAGEHLVAVDWVGATKMGLDPMVSRYMQLAVQALGTPVVEVDGDLSVYSPWVNVPRPMIEFWDNAEENLGFTNTVFAALNRDYMSPSFRRKPRSWGLRIVGALFGRLGALVYQPPRRP